MVVVMFLVILSRYHSWEYLTNTPFTIHGGIQQISPSHASCGAFDRFSLMSFKQMLLFSGLGEHHRRFVPIFTYLRGF
jgi:hypothetical protein